MSRSTTNDVIDAANSVRLREARVLFRPGDAALRFLPEGPFPCGQHRFSWVAIQHGGDATVGSLNVFDLSLGRNTRHDLPGRPGFAYAAADGQSFVVGLERHVRVFHPASGQWTDVCGPVDTAVQGTIINDATLCADGLIFGCKDLKFAEGKAGLYFWRTRDRRLFTLRTDQICSNGKQVVQFDGRPTLLDIDSPTKTVVAYPFDAGAGTLGEPRIAIDLRDGDSFPDGMIVAPDGQSVIIAFYDPRDVDHGEARQYRLADGQLQTIWRTPGSPRVTCPQLMLLDGQVVLILTTAVEHMTADQEAKHPHAGCLFIAETDFTSLPPARVFAS